MTLSRRDLKGLSPAHRKLVEEAEAGTIPASHPVSHPVTRQAPKRGKDTTPTRAESQKGVQWQWGAFGGRSHRWQFKRDSWYTACTKPGYQSQKEPDGSQAHPCTGCLEEA